MLPEQKVPILQSNLPVVTPDARADELERRINKLENRAGGISMTGAMFLISAMLDTLAYTTFTDGQPNAAFTILGILSTIITPMVGYATFREHPDVPPLETALREHMTQIRRDAFKELSPSQQEQILVRDADLVARYTILKLYGDESFPFNEALPAITELGLTISPEEENPEDEEFLKAPITLEDIHVTKSILEQQASQGKNDLVDAGIGILFDRLGTIQKSLENPTQRRSLPSPDSL